MGDVPIRLASGKIGCGRCGTALIKGSAPFYIRKEYVGVFESYVCPICNYSALTEGGYEAAIKQAKRMDLGEQQAPEIPKPSLDSGGRAPSENMRIRLERQDAELRPLLEAEAADTSCLVGATQRDAELYPPLPTYAKYQKPQMRIWENLG